MKPTRSSTPHVVVMVGIPGSGKTTFAEHYAKTFQAVFLNSKQLAHDANIDEATTEQLIATLLPEVLKTHQPIILEVPAFNYQHRQALEEVIASTGYRTLLVWVQTETSEARHRAISKRAAIPLSREEFADTIAAFEPPTDKERVAVISGKHTYATQLKSVLRHLVTPRPKQPLKKRDNPPRSSRKSFMR